MTKPPDSPEMLRVRFDARPPAELIAGDVKIVAGATGELPAEVARELAANPNVPLVLLDEDAPASAPRSDDLPGVEAHVNPTDTPVAATTTKEN